MIDKNTITLTEKEFKMLVSCGFISGYRFAATNGIRNYSEKDLRNASMFSEDVLWIKVKKAEQYENKLKENDNG